MVPPGSPIPGPATLIVLPGSKATIADMRALREEGWDIDILAHYRRGGLILGLCGGYQMLGKSISDPLGLEGPAESIEGLGLLDLTTELASAKRLQRVRGESLGAPVSGYVMHMGETSGPGRNRPFATLEGTPEGAVDARQIKKLEDAMRFALSHGEPM